MKNLPAVSMRSLALASLVAILAFSAVFALGASIGRANDTTDPSQMVSAGSPVPLPAQVTANQAEIRPGALSNKLSYYFIAGNTFTTHGSIDYTRQVNGCVNQMPIGIDFYAPVNLPMGSQVVSVTLYTYNTASDATTSSAYFVVNDGMGFNASTVSADSQPYTIGYQQNSTIGTNPWIVDGQNHSFLVTWRKQNGTADSPLLSLCGVRVAYYAPLGSLYLPSVTK
jgi:hypothetical protein